VKKHIFVGIDGGGTKTKLRVEDEEGHLLAQGKGGPANIRISVETSWKSIRELIDRTLDSIHLKLEDSDVLFHAGFGLAGTEIPDAVHEFLARPHPFRTLLLKSDAYAACLGAHDGEDGSIIIIGTGVVGYQISKEKSLQVGGWGFPHADEGGGAWLGLQGIRHTLQSLDFREKKTDLTESIFEHFNHNLTQLVVWANKANSSRFAEIAPIVIEHVQKKEPLAIHLIQRAAKEIDKVGHALMQRGENSLPCSLFGGIASYIEPWLEKALREKLVQRKHDATKGCIYMIRKKVLGKK
jgi:glucosamine kinase